jgi:2-deoxy-D-gluconate 3-dehydrogenase
MKSFDLTGKVALVTGGNGGIGLGMALGLAEAGAAIVVTGRQVEKNAAAVKQLEKAGAKAIEIALDIGDAGACRALVDRAVERMGRLDILINNAGTTVRKVPQDLTDEEFERVVDVNMTATFRCSRAAYPHMLRAGGGKIVNIGSMLSIFGTPWAAPYAASKGGVVQMSRAFATAWAKDNIQVNCVLPGWIDTDLTRGAREQVEGLNERVLARTPAGRWGKPVDLAGLAVFLASPASDFITGTAIPADGGYSIMG